MASLGLFRSVSTTQFSICQYNSRSCAFLLLETASAFFIHDVSPHSCSVVGAWTASNSEGGLLWHRRRSVTLATLRFCSRSAGALLPSLVSRWLPLRWLRRDALLRLVWLDPRRVLPSCPVSSGQFFEYIYHIGCAISLHSITNSGLIPGRQILSRERQTVFFTAVNPMEKEYKDPCKLDLTKPRLAWYKQKTWKRHQDTVYWVDIQLTQRKGFKFYQTRCNAIILYDTLPAYCISKVVVMESGDVMYEKVFVSPRLPPMISFKDNLMKRI